MVMIMYLLNSFFVYSFIGYVFEIAFGFIMGVNNPESGVLYGPWTPIYGIAAILIIIISERVFRDLHMDRWKETSIVFLITVPILMGLEFLGGYLIEVVFGFSFWDYSNYKFHIGKYTCLSFGILWGIMGIIFIYFLRPFLDKYIKRISRWVSILLVFLFIFDLIIRLLKEYNIF